MIPSLSQIVALLATVALGASARTMAPLMVPNDKAVVIPNKYIIVFKEPEAEVSSQSMDRVNHASWLQSRIEEEDADKSRLEHSFNVNGISGYTGYFSDELIDEIRERGEVDYVEADQIVYAMNMKKPSAIKRKEIIDYMRMISGPVSGKSKIHMKSKARMNSFLVESNSNAVTQNDAPWGLSRISHKGIPEDFTEYKYPSSAGDDVDVYVVDTGINIEHVEFEGRARWGKTIPLFDQDIDGNGHGTHCAGTIGSKTFGVAKKANLIAVKVLRTNGFGTNSDVIKGVEWVTHQHTQNSRKGRRSAANMSLGGGRSLTLEKAVNKAVEVGVHFAVAAGNDNEDACDYSPAAADGPITVGASTNSDSMAYFSNHGKCVDIFAPGLDITSTWIGSNTAVNTISGTSMASPHVAGVLALYLGEQDWSPKDLKEMLKVHAVMDKLTGLPLATENRLLNTMQLLASIESKK